MDKHERAQLRIISEKALLGDDEAKRLHESGDALKARAYAKRAARELGVCECTRTDGIVCGRQLSKGEAPLCWPCWARKKDNKPCAHSGRV